MEAGGQVLHLRVGRGGGAVSWQILTNSPSNSGGNLTEDLIAGRLRVSQRRLLNDAGWFSWRSVSDLAALGDVLHGRADKVWRRFDAYVIGGRTMVRVLGMLGADNWVKAGLDFSPRTDGYAAARQQVVDEANRRGLYVKFDLFADAQIVVPDADERDSWTLEFAAFCLDAPGVLPGLSNEPFKNGWSEADDPALLRLADIFARAIGHRDFAIGDPADGDNPDASAETTRIMVAVSKHANIAELHPDRSYGTDGRWRRWIDHLEGMTDVVHQLAPNVAYAVDEPIGAALTEQPGRRDSDPDAFVAAQFVSLLCGFAGFTYHKIDSEISVEQLPGFYEATELLALVPVSPDWTYVNDGWSGSPTNGITWTGETGKMRHLVRGSQAWSVAYGDGDWSSVRWSHGWVPRVVYQGQRVCVWMVNQ